MPISLGTGTGRDPGLARFLWTLKQELLSLGQGKKNPKGRSSPLTPASNVLQESLNWTQTLFPLVHLQRQQPDHAPVLEPCSSWCQRGQGLCQGPALTQASPGVQGWLSNRL